MSLDPKSKPCLFEGGTDVTAYVTIDAALASDSVHILSMRLARKPVNDTHIGVSPMRNLSAICQISVRAC